MLHLLTDLQQEDLLIDVYPFGEYHHVVIKDKYGEELLRKFLLNSAK